MRPTTLFLPTLLVISCHTFPHKQNHGEENLPAGLLDENILARIWRTALTGPPSLNDPNGWPQYTKGAQNNTPSASNDDISIKPGTYIKTAASGWTSGFFPDMIWKAYERLSSHHHHHYHDDSDYINDNEPNLDEWLNMAKKWTDPLITNINLTNTHDLGFLANPFMSALDIANETKWIPVLGNMSSNLASRFVSSAGVIRSWDTNNSSFASTGSHEDSVLVIIDNMMNLALLFRSENEGWSGENNGNNMFRDIAVSHANRTRDHHIRSDGSSFHVCDYSGTNGELYLCRTAQGLRDDSTWARGQAWAIYGFAEAYEYTMDLSYLETAMRTADWFLDHLPSDGLPFWDFDAEYLLGVTPRDSSAAAVAASGMLLIDEHISKRKDFGTGKQRNYKKAVIDLLSASVDLALAGEISFADIDPDDVEASLGAITDFSTPANTNVSTGFESIVMHGTGNNNPNARSGKNWDTGLIYGDFYFVEAGNKLL